MEKSCDILNIKCLKLDYYSYNLFPFITIHLCAVKWLYKSDYIINSAFQVPGMLGDKHTDVFVACNVSLCPFFVVRNTTKAVSHVTARGPLLVLW